MTDARRAATLSSKVAENRPYGGCPGNWNRLFPRPRAGVFFLIHQRRAFVYPWQSSRLSLTGTGASSKHVSVLPRQFFFCRDMGPGFWGLFPLTRQREGSPEIGIGKIFRVQQRQLGGTPGLRAGGLNNDLGSHLPAATGSRPGDVELRLTAWRRTSRSPCFCWSVRSFWKIADKSYPNSAASRSRVARTSSTIVSRIIISLP